MQLIDTHAHLYLKQFNKDRNEVIERAFKQDVTKIFLPNIDSSSIAGIEELHKKYPKVCYPMIGLHPCSVNSNYKEELKIMELNLQTNYFIAIGEIGIDRYWSDEFLAEQTQNFEYQLNLSLKYHLPVCIHVRNSFDEVFAVLKNYRNQLCKGVFHCFTGTKEQAEKVIDLGFSLGIGGVVTFKNNTLKSYLAQIPLQHILLETDSPYLAPHPFRGKRNEPQHIRVIAKNLASLYNIPLEEVAATTTQNALSLFRLMKQ